MTDISFQNLRCLFENGQVSTGVKAIVDGLDSWNHLGAGFGAVTGSGEERLIRARASPVLSPDSENLRVWNRRVA